MEYFKEFYSDLKENEIFDKNGNYLGDNCINILLFEQRYILFEKNIKNLYDTYMKIPSSVSGNKVYDKKGNKLKIFYR